MGLPDSDQVPRVWPYSGTGLGQVVLSPTGLSPAVARLSRRLRLERLVHVVRPTTPAASRRFGLFPFRSPLLGESRLLSFPPGTEMFQFPGLSTASYEFRCG